MGLKILFTLFFILYGASSISAQEGILKKPSQQEFGQDVLPQSISLRLPPNGKASDIDIGIRIYIGKFSKEVDPATGLVAFESYGDRSLLNTQVNQLRSFLLIKIAEGKLSEAEVNEIIADLIDTHKKILVTTNKLTSVLIKAEYPFQPSLKALPKPE